MENTNIAGEMAEFNLGLHRVALTGYDWKDIVASKKCDVYHHNDMDGRAAAAIISIRAVSYNNDEPYMIEVNYNSSTIASNIKANNVSDAEYAIIVDYSASRDDLREALNHYKAILWLDHHESSLRDVAKISELFKDKLSDGTFAALLDNNRSGALIAHDMFMDGTDYDCRKVVELIDDYDRWQKTTIESDYLNQYCYHTSASADPNSMFWIDLLLSDNGLSDALKYGKELYDVVMSMNDIKCRAYTYDATFEGLNIRVFEGFGNSQIFGDHIKDYDAVAIIHKSAGKWQFSLYTVREDLDLSKICAKYNGGGHKKAAGATTAKRPF